jgi:hypothetical protein
LPSISLEDVCSLILFPAFATGIVDTGGKFATDIVNTNCTSGKICLGGVDTDGKFSTGVVDTSGAP